MEFIKNLLKKNIVKYFLCSAFTALLEFALLFLLKGLFSSLDTGIVIANTIAVTVSALVHFILTSRIVFQVKLNYQSAAVYALTFVIGLLVQNGVLWLCYEHLFARFISNEQILTLLSKGASLAASFFITFLLRSVLNKKIKEKENNE